jgi:HAD superfamily hydrolase (TIGR01459 family)
MICANPDITVVRGERVVYCAGALAQLYESLGGKVIYAGKPHAPIYDRAIEIIEQCAGRPVLRERIIGIGDGIRTDVLGALAAGLRAIFVASAIHVQGPLDAAALRHVFAGVTGRPTAAMPVLAW